MCISQTLNCKAIAFFLLIASAVVVWSDYYLIALLSLVRSHSLGVVSVTSLWSRLLSPSSATWHVSSAHHSIPLSSFTSSSPSLILHFGDLSDPRAVNIRGGQTTCLMRVMLVFDTVVPPRNHPNSLRPQEQLTIGPVSKQRLFILDPLLCDHSCVSGDIALRIQHDVSRRHTKTSKPGYSPRRFLTSGINSFSLGYNSPNNKLKTDYVITKLTTQTHCRMKTYDDVTGSS